MELYDQHGYLFRLGVGGYIRYGDILVRAKDVEVVVNDDLWGGVQYIAAKAEEMDVFALGNPDYVAQVPMGATGSIEIRSRDEQHPEMDRIARLTADSVVAIVVRNPNDGQELRRLTMHACRWGPPSVQPELEGLRPKWRTFADFKAEWFEDEWRTVHVT